jgi:hypothetical protein
MPPYTKLPRPAGHINIPYSPMSPANWGIVAAQFHVFVYPDVRVALQALLQSAITLHAQRLEAGAASLFSDYIYYRGQTEITHRLLPTRLRGPRRELQPRERWGVPGGPPDKDPRDHFGDWYEDIEPMREIEESVAELSADELKRRDESEAADVLRASKLSSIARLGDFQKRAAVRHYSHAPSSILDLTTNPEVAAFFATGGGAKPPMPGQIGMLWAIDLNFLAGIFKFEIISIPDGIKIRMRETRDDWGDNKKMFEDQGILPACLEMTSVALPFGRPLAQHARFLSLTGENGEPLPLATEMTWWSIIERRAYMCAFIQDGKTYEQSSHNITEASLLPKDDELATTLA